MTSSCWVQSASTAACLTCRDNSRGSRNVILEVSSPCFSCFMFDSPGPCVCTTQDSLVLVTSRRKYICLPSMLFDPRSGKEQLAPEASREWEVPMMPIQVIRGRSQPASRCYDV